MNTIIISVVLLGVLGIAIGLLLGVAGKFFSVEVDERVEQVRECLPGNNCGGCGFPGCDGLAEAIVAGTAEVNGCPVGGAPVAEKIGSILGVEAGSAVKMVAKVRCAGTCEQASVKYNYIGAQDCRQAVMVPGRGDKSCTYGCLGFGTCVKECPFDAIHIENGIAVVDKEVCRACGKCVAVCPRHLISMEPYHAKHIVLCSSKDKGIDTIKSCVTGCIGCGICVKNCPAGAIAVKDFHAVIDQEKCTGCGICVEKCPKHVIV